MHPSARFTRSGFTRGPTVLVQALRALRAEGQPQMAGARANFERASTKEKLAEKCAEGLNTNRDKLSLHCTRWDIARYYAATSVVPVPCGSLQDV